jgi:alpha-L-arabinofuranosidase
MAENVRAFTGQPGWSNYTFSLKARKLGGAEGFLIPFLVKDEEAKAWWNIGGWGNVRHGIELDGIAGADVPGSIETGRWYDIRIEVKGANVRCFLDDKLIHDVSYAATKPLYATASLAKRANEVILKVVNVSDTDMETDLHLEGGKLLPTATATVLASQRPEDENTLEQPRKVSPTTLPLGNCGPAFSHTFPANSVTVLRLKLQ